MTTNEIVQENTLSTAPPQHAERGHHKFGCSKLNYLDECPAFTSTDGSSEAAEDGTRLHEIMDKTLDLFKSSPGTGSLADALDEVIKTEPVDDEERELLLYCVRALEKFIYRKGVAVHNEIKVQILNPDETELNHGWLDCLLVIDLPSGRQVGVLDDFKFGWIPIPPAFKNLQGMGYALACFLKFSKLDKIGVRFIQPRLNSTTEHVYERGEMMAMYRRIKAVIDRAIFVHANADSSAAAQQLKLGDHCQFCALRSKCSAVANHIGKSAAVISNLPAPKTFDVSQVTDPKDVALLRYWVGLVEDSFESIKKHANETAQLNGGVLEAELPDGEVVRYEIKERSADRVLGETPMIADALSHIVEPHEILRAAELSITKLEPIVAAALVEQARVEGRKLTKKAATEQFVSTLESQGLLSRPDAKVRYLKRIKSSVKQITQGTK